MYERRHKLLWWGQAVWPLVPLAAALVALGCLAIARAEEFLGLEGRYLPRQIVWCVLSLAAMLGVAAINYRRLARWSYVLLVLAIMLLVAVYFFPPINGARRWLRLGPLSMQPSELAKLAFVLALARYLRFRESYRELAGLAAPLILVSMPVLLILREPDLGTALVFFPVMFVMLFAAGARASHLALVLVAGALFSPIVWSQMSREQRSRVSAMLEQTGPGEKPSDDGFHLHQARLMFALGGYWGNDVEDLVSDNVSTVPEPHTDSILSVLGQRFGLVGVAGTLALYVLLVGQILRVAQAARDPFGKLLAVGVAGLIGVQVLINAGMMVGLLPITGLALPFVSYGGTSLLTTAVALGLVISVARHPGYELGTGLK